MPPTAVLRRCLRSVFSPAGGTVAAALGLLVFLGCLSIGGTTTSESHSPPDTDHTFHQEGRLILGLHEERDVYYPEPYVSPPYLELNGPGPTGCELLDQQPTHFRVRNVSTTATGVSWSARGVRGKVTQTITPGPPALPAEPVPAVPAESTAKER
jgi:hypothetical protein